MVFWRCQQDHQVSVQLTKETENQILTSKIRREKGDITADKNEIQKNIKICIKNLSSAKLEIA